MTSTSSLIDSLVADAKPVRRLGPPSIRAICWLLFAVFILALVAVGHGLRPDLALRLREPVFITHVSAALLTAALAALASFIVSVPGRSWRWLWLPVPALAVWIGSVGSGCLTDWVRIGPQGISAGETAECFATLALTGVPLSLLMLIMLRHVARLAPTSTAMMASLPVAAMSAVAVSLCHPIDATIMILIWNFGVAALFLVASGFGGRRLFGWVALKA
ncbi:conserved hypothetical protein [Burkholderia sp. H160]|nr:conserved hypothetical protein [Burkholderia sp. H160]